jgi:hypothetical protein
MGKTTDITGNRYGKLTAIRLDHIKKRSGGKSDHYWLFRCDCGKEVVLPKYVVLKEKRGRKSCGCSRKELLSLSHRTHGETHTRLYHIWQGIKQRCELVNGDHWKDYGERGIKVCSEWHTYEIFKDWALSNGYQDDLSIDRIDVNGNYEPSNCRWATSKEQANNKRNNLKIAYNGEILTAAEWSIRLGGARELVSERLRYGWDQIRAITTKPDRAENMRKDISGRRFWSLTAIKYDGNRITKGGHPITYWLFRCDCGKMVSISRCIVVLLKNT